MTNHCNISEQIPSIHSVNYPCLSLITKQIPDSGQSKTSRRGVAFGHVPHSFCQLRSSQKWPRPATTTQVLEKTLIFPKHCPPLCPVPSRAAGRVPNYGPPNDIMVHRLHGFRLKCFTISFWGWRYGGMKCHH
jgi:hypothetical protein